MVLLLPTEPPLAVVVVNRLAVVIVLLFVTPLGFIGLDISEEKNIYSFVTVKPQKKKNPHNIDIFLQHSLESNGTAAAFVTLAVFLGLEHSLAVFSLIVAESIVFCRLKLLGTGAFVVMV